MKAKDDQLLQDLERAIADDPGVAAREWDSLAVVSELRDDRAGLYGYLYRGSEVEPMELEGRALFELLPGLQEAATRCASRPLKARVFRLKKSDPALDLDLEFEDPDRYRLTADTVYRLPLELKP